MNKEKFFSIQFTDCISPVKRFLQYNYIEFKNTPLNECVSEDFLCPMTRKEAFENFSEIIIQSRLTLLMIYSEIKFRDLNYYINNLDKFSKHDKFIIGLVAFENKTEPKKYEFISQVYKDKSESFGQTSHNRAKIFTLAEAINSMQYLANIGFMIGNANLNITNNQNL